MVGWSRRHNPPSWQFITTDHNRPYELGKHAVQKGRTVYFVPACTALASTGSNPRSPGCGAGRCSTSTYQAPAVGLNMLAHFWGRRSGSLHRLKLRRPEATNTGQDRPSGRAVQSPRSRRMPRHRSRRRLRCLSFARALPSDAKVPATWDPSMQAARRRKEPSMRQ